MGVNAFKMTMKQNMYDDKIIRLHELIRSLEEKNKYLRIKSEIARLNDANFSYEKRDDLPVFPRKNVIMNIWIIQKWLIKMLRTTLKDAVDTA